MLKPKEIEVNGKTYIISRIPAVEAREIVTQYPITGMPKLGDYKMNEELMFKLMSYVSVPVGDLTIALTNKSLINNHVENFEVLLTLEAKMMEYNVSFFQDGRISSFFDDIAQKVPQWILKIWTALSEQSLPTEKQL